MFGIVCRIRVITTFTCLYFIVNLHIALTYIQEIITSHSTPSSLHLVRVLYYISCLKLSQLDQISKEVMHSNNRGRCVSKSTLEKAIQKPSDLNSNISRCRKFVDVAQSR